MNRSIQVFSGDGMLKYKQKSNTLIDRLNPVMDYLKSCSDATIDWTTSLPIANPPLMVKQTASRACLNGNLHTYYNTDIDDDLISLIFQYFKNKSINCSKNDIKIRYSAFDILRDFYASLDWDENDRILICAPTFGYYIYQAQEYSIKTELLYAQSSDGWKIKPENLDKALENPSIKIVLLTNPVNPTGIFYDEREIEEIAAIIKKHNVFVIADEIFSDICFTPQEKPYSIAAVAGIYERSLTLSGLGKSRGVRLSFACGQTSALTTIPVSGIFKPLQAAAIASLQNSDENRVYLEATLDQYKSRISFVQNKIVYINNALNDHFKTSKKIYVDTFITPTSTNIFLLSFPAFRDALVGGQKICTSLDLANYFYQKTGVAMVPGEGFFIEGTSMVLRIPLSVQSEELEEGFNRILKALI